MPTTQKPKTQTANLKVDENGNFIHASGSLDVLAKILSTDPGIPDNPSGGGGFSGVRDYGGGLLGMAVPEDLKSQMGNYYATNRMTNNPELGLLKQAGISIPETVSQPQRGNTGMDMMGDWNFLMRGKKEGRESDESINAKMIGKYGEQFKAWLKARDYKSQIIPTGDGYMVADFDPKTGGYALKPLTDASGKAVKIGKPLTGEMIITEQQIGSAKDLFDRIKTLYKPEYVGAVEGRWGAIKSATVGNPEEQAAFYSNLQDLNNSLVYLKSGKQINEQEYKRLKDAMPHRNLPDSDFQARMKQFEITLETILKERVAKSGGYGGIDQFRGGTGGSSPDQQALDAGYTQEEINAFKRQRGIK